jgi:2-keto-4-pentenoate hydratase/2-oxohepta-3-ene-1,7-dioic acid hydratase in catechol pathway
MKLVTYRVGCGECRLGVIANDLVVDVERMGDARNIALPSTMLSFIDERDTVLPITKHLLGEFNQGFPAGCALPLANVDLLAPIPRPRKNIFGIGLNYREHVAESALSLDTDDKLPKQPVVFSKPPTAVIGPGAAIHHDARMTQQLDWEVELAVILGRRATRVRKEDALSYVFGYTIIIDISARDNRRAGQWLFSKGQDTYAPMGPCIVTTDELPDPHNLNLSLAVNGVTKQDSNTRFLIFDIPHLIADISSGITLEPGDIIATGTPSGVGAGRTPQEWLWPGDVVEAKVQGIGEIRHPVVRI